MKCSGARRKRNARSQIDMHQRRLTSSSCAGRAELAFVLKKASGSTNPNIMAKIYTLKEPQHVRDDAAMNVALLRYMRFFANGVEINPLSTETAARYDAILEKIEGGVPLAEITELQEVFQEIEKAEERRRLLREFKKTYREISAELVSRQRFPTRDEVMNLRAGNQPAGIGRRF
jgi:hypothetical protein